MTTGFSGICNIFRRDVIACLDIIDEGSFYFEQWVLDSKSILVSNKIKANNFLNHIENFTSYPYVVCIKMTD